MAYNRFGFALVALVLLECLQREDGDREDAGEFTGGLSTGMAMALALFLKASYFTVAVAIVLLSFALRRLNGVSRRPGARLWPSRIRASGVHGFRRFGLCS